MHVFVENTMQQKYMVAIKLQRCQSIIRQKINFLLHEFSLATSY